MQWINIKDSKPEVGQYIVAVGRCVPLKEANLPFGNYDLTVGHYCDNEKVYCFEEFFMPVEYWFPVPVFPQV